MGVTRSHSVTANSSLRPLDRQDGWIATLVALASVAIYVRTAAPGLLPGDGGEFQVLGNLVGHAHTTGYWVYTLLARLWAYLPLDSPAYRITLFSAAMGAVAMGGLYLAARLATDSRWAALVAAAVVGPSATVWSQATIAEVYTAGAAFAAAILVLLFQWAARPRLGYLVAAGVLGGLSLGVHGSVLLLAPAALAFVLVGLPPGRRDLPAALAGAIVGLLLMFGAFCLVDALDSPYSIIQVTYMPAHSAWGLPAETLQHPLGRFWFLLSGRQWRSAMFADPFSLMPRNSLAYLRALQRDLGLIALLLAALGAITVSLRRWRVALLIGLGYAVHMLYTLNYQIGDIHVFYVNAHLYLGIGLAAGVAALLRWSSRWEKRRHAVAPLLAVVLVISVELSRSAPPTWSLLRAGEAHRDLSGGPTAQETTRWHSQIATTISALEPNALVLLGWRELYPYIYVAAIEQGRDDLQFVEAMPYAEQDGMGESMRAYLADAARQRTIYADQPLPALAPPLFETSEQLVGPTRFYVYRLAP